MVGTEVGTAVVATVVALVVLAGLVDVAFVVVVGLTCWAETLPTAAARASALRTFMMVKGQANNKRDGAG